MCSYFHLTQAILSACAELVFSVCWTFCDVTNNAHRLRLSSSFLWWAQRKEKTLSSERENRVSNSAGSSVCTVNFSRSSGRRRPTISDWKGLLVASKQWQTIDLINTNWVPELYSMRHSWERVLQQQEKWLFNYLNSAFSQNPEKEKNDLDFFSHWLTVEVCWCGIKSLVDIFHTFTFGSSSRYTVDQLFCVPDSV